VRADPALAAGRGHGRPGAPAAAGAGTGPAEPRLLRATYARQPAGDRAGGLPARGARAWLRRASRTAVAQPAAGIAAGGGMAVAGLDQSGHRLGRGRADLRPARPWPLL